MGLDAASLFNVNGMVAIITGGSSGIGVTWAHALDQNGAAKVFILGRRENKLKEVAAAAKNKTLIPIVCDCSKKESLQAAAAQIEKQTPFINLLVANAGVLCKSTGLIPRPEGTTVEQVAQDLWEKTTWEDADNCLATNIAGSYFTFVAFLKLLGAGNEHPDSKWKGLVQSQFITNSSAGALWRGEEPAYMYNASKSALINLTKNIATAFARYGIRANSIAPGLFLTEINENDFPRDPDPKLPGSYPASWLPATRAGDDEDIAGVLLFLASRAGAYLNGCVLLTDGGMVSVKPGSY
ncbi:NAD(P)-binding protein [Hypoxylon sp. NC1633]|nr:NAD(P)-binding protein [Hypoxylon sp. NC1633]